jgi:hypothetical protein
MAVGCGLTNRILVKVPQGSRSERPIFFLQENHAPFGAQELQGQVENPVQELIRFIHLLDETADLIEMAQQLACGGPGVSAPAGDLRHQLLLRASIRGERLLANGERWSSLPDSTSHIAPDR